MTICDVKEVVCFSISAYCFDFMARDFQLQQTAVFIRHATVLFNSHTSPPYISVDI